MGEKKRLRICDIQKAGIQGKPLTAQVTFDKGQDEGRKFRVKLTQGKDVIFATVQNNVELAKRFKGFIKGKKVVEFPPKTFRAVKKSKANIKQFPKLHKHWLLAEPSFLNPLSSPKKGKGRKSVVVPKDDTGLDQANLQIGKRGKIEGLPIQNVFIKSGTVYRYWGCSKCSKKVRPTRSPKCNGYCKQQAKSRVGVSCQVKVCVLLKNMEVVEGENSTRSLNGLVVYNYEAIGLLGGKAWTEKVFKEDGEAQKHFDDYVVGLKVNFRLYRKLKGKSNLPRDPFAKQITATSVGKVTFRTVVLKPNEAVLALDSVPSGSGGGEPPLEVPQEVFDFKLPILRVKLKDSDDHNNKDEADTIYPLPTKPKGLVLVINNYFLGRYDKERKGSMTDVHYLLEIFGQMGYIIFNLNGGGDVHEVKNRKALRALIARFKKALKDGDYASSFVIVMSHGSLNEVELLGTNNPKSKKKSPKANLVADILCPFSDSSFPEFKGKPKIFINGYCQGNDVSEYTLRMVPPHDTLSDALICNSAPPGYPQIRHTTLGTVFIHFLVKMMMEHGKRLELQDILKQTQIKIREFRTEHGYPWIAVPTWWTNIFDKFYLCSSEQDVVVENGNGVEDMEIDDDGMEWNGMDP